MPTVLAIDDERGMTLLFEGWIKHWGYTPVTAQSGEEGLRLALSASPDVIILDEQMPGMDGYTVLSKLTRNRQTREVPVIFLIGDHQGGAGAATFKAWKAGAEAVWFKGKMKEKQLKQYTSRILLALGRE